MQPAAFSVIDPVPPTAKIAGSLAGVGPADANGSHPGEQPTPPAAREAGPLEVTSAVPEKKPALSTAYFCGDSSFFSLHWALQTIAREKLTGTLHAFWSRDSVDLLARDGQVVVVTTRNLDLYCE